MIVVARLINRIKPSKSLFSSHNLVSTCVKQLTSRHETTKTPLISPYCKGIAYSINILDISEIGMCHFTEIF